MEDVLNKEISHSGHIHKSKEKAEKGKGNHHDIGKGHQKEIPTGSYCCHQNTEGDLGQRAEGLGSSFNTKHGDRLSDAIHTAESTKEVFIAQ